MATIASENITFSLSAFTQYNQDNHENMYERFSVDVATSNKPLFSSGILRKEYELCGGNIEMLIDSIGDVLTRKQKYVEFEFMEPDFEFIIRHSYDPDDLLFKSVEMESGFEIAVWINSAPLNHGAYGSSGVGVRLCVKESELKKFHEDLILEYSQRKIEHYY